MGKAIKRADHGMDDLIQNFDEMRKAILDWGKALKTLRVEFQRVFDLINGRRHEIPQLNDKITSYMLVMFHTVESVASPRSLNEIEAMGASGPVEDLMYCRT